MGFLDSLSGGFDGQAVLQSAIDEGASSSWFTPILDAASTAADWGTGAFNYIENHEWAANALAGGATAGLNYLVQKDAAKEAEQLAQMKSDREDRRFFVGGNQDLGAYGSLTNGALTNGLLTAGSKR